MWVVREIALQGSCWTVQYWIGGDPLSSPVVNAAGNEPCPPPVLEEAGWRFLAGQRGELGAVTVVRAAALERPVS